MRFAFSATAAAVSALVFSACASAPKPRTPAQMLVGSWNCTVTQEMMTVKGVMNYAPDGTSTFKINVTGEGGGMALDLAGEGNGSWRLLEADTKLEESIKAVKVTSAKLNGNDIDPAMVQGMADQMLANQTSISDVKITETTLETTALGGTNTCTR